MASDDVCVYCGEYYSSHNSGNKCRTGEVGRLFAKEGSIKLSTVQAGTKVRMYSRDGSICNEITSDFLDAIIMSTSYNIGSNNFLLGWKQGEIKERYAWTGNDIDKMRKLDAGFKYGYWVDGNLVVKRIFGSNIVATSAVSRPVGLTCSSKFCKSFVHMAEPNQPDGSFVCYGCRARPSYMR